MPGIPAWAYAAYKQPGHELAYSGRTALKRYFPQATTQEVENFLSSVYAYPLHRDAKKPKKRNPYFIYRIRQQVQMDLIDMTHYGKILLPKFNDGFRYLITAIDTFTKKAWIAKLKTKDTIASLNAIKLILHKMETEEPFLLPEAIYSDQGGELKNAQLHRYLRSKGIRIYYAYTDVKAAVVERFNRTIEELIYKHMTEKETNRWIDDVDAHMQTYNSRGHRSLNWMSPNDAEKQENQMPVRRIHVKRYMEAASTPRVPKYKIGDIVRIKLKPTIFSRGYHWRFSPEYYKIIEIKTHMPQPMYKVENMSTANQPKRSFYFEQMQPVTSDIWRVEKVIKTEKRKGKEWLYVKWLNFHGGHNSWIPKENVKEIFNTSGKKEMHIRQDISEDESDDPMPGTSTQNE